MRGVSRATGLALLIVLASTGCDAPRPGVPGQVRDSAGVAIVENPDPSTLPLRRPEPEAEVAIGVLEGDPTRQLFDVRAGAVLPGPRVAILNAGTREVRLYAPSGALEASQGGEGDGPEEYALPTRLWVLPGDSLLVWDPGHRRATVLTRNAEFARTFTLDGDLVAPEVEGIGPDGGLVVLDQRWPVGGTFDGTEWVELPGVLLRYAPDGSPADDTLGVVTWRTLKLFGGGDGPVEGFRRNLELPTRFSVTAGGVWVGDPGEAQVRFLAMDGEVTRIVRWPAGDRRVTDEIRQGELARRLEAAPNDEIRRVIRQAEENAEYADVFPAFQELLADAMGRLWIRTYPPPGADRPPRWWVTDPLGRALHAVELPRDATLLWAGLDRVLVRVRDELDVERVRLLRLAAPVEPPSS